MADYYISVGLIIIQYYYFHDYHYNILLPPQPERFLITFLVSTRGYYLYLSLISTIWTDQSYFE